MQPIREAGPTPPTPDTGAVWVFVQVVQAGPEAGMVKISHNIAQAVSDPRVTADVLEHAARSVREAQPTGARSGLILPSGVLA